MVLAGCLIVSIQAANPDGAAAWEGFKEGSYATYRCVIKVAGEERGTLEETRTLKKRDGAKVVIAIETDGNVRDVEYAALAVADEFKEVAREEMTIDGSVWKCKVMQLKNGNGSLTQWRCPDRQDAVVKEETETKRTKQTATLDRTTATLVLDKTYECWVTKTVVEGAVQESREAWYAAGVPGLEVMKTTKTTIGRETIETTWKLTKTGKGE